MKNVSIIAAVALGVGFLLVRKRNDGSRLIPLPSPTARREYEDQLANSLEYALACGDTAMWDVVSEACRTLGRGDLPGRVRREWPTLAEQFDRT